MSSAIRMGKAFVELFVEDTKMMRGMKRAEIRLHRFSRMAKRMGDATRAAGRRVLAGAAVAAAPFAIGIKSAVEFEYQMAKVNTMLDGSDKSLKKATEAVKTMAMEYGQSTETVSEGLYDLLSANFSLSESLTILTATSRAAVGGFTDVKTSTSAVITMLRAYNLEASDAGMISDWLFSVVAKGRVTYEQLAQNIGGVATISKMANLSLNELGAAITTVTMKGYSVEEAITSIRAALLGIAAPTEASRKAAKMYGIELSEATLKSEGLVGILEKLQGISVADLKEIFPNVRSVKALAALIASIDKVKADTSFLSNGAGEADKAFAKVAVTMMFATKQAIQFGKIVAVELGMILKDDIRNVLTNLMDFAKWLLKVIKQNKNLVRSLAKVVVMVALIGGGLMVAGAMFNTVAGMATVFAISLGVATNIASTLAYLFINYRVILGVLANGFKIAWIAIKRFGIVFTAIVAIIEHSTGAFSAAWTAINEGLDSVGRGFKETKQVATESWEAINQAVSDGRIEDALSVVTNAFHYLWVKSLNTVLKLFYGFTDEVSGNWIDFTSNLNLGASSFAILWGGIFMGSLKMVGAFVVGTINSVMSFFDSAITGARELWAVMQGIFDQDFDVDGAISGLDAGLKDRQEERIKQVVEIASSGVDDFAGIPATLQKNVQDNEDNRSSQQGARQGAYSERVSSLDGEIAAARGEYKKALTKAATSVKKGVDDADTVRVGRYGKADDEIKNRLPQVVGGPVQTRGSFSGEVINRMSGGHKFEEMRKQRDSRRDKKLDGIKNAVEANNSGEGTVS